MERKNVFIHETAEVSDGSEIGEGTKVWHYCQIRERARIGRNCNFGKGVYVDQDVIIGNNVKVQNRVNIYHGVVIEDDVFLGPSMTFTNDLYPRSYLWDDSRVVKTLVKQGASIGANATVICGVTIGRYAMVGAGAVVTTDVPDHALVVGNPARIRGFMCKCGMKADFSGEKEGRIIEMLCKTCDTAFDIDQNIYDRIKYR